MHIHNVASYAPEGHRYITTEYADGKTKHVFARVEDGQEVACEFIAKDAAEERGYLEAFKAEHTPVSRDEPEHETPAELEDGDDEGEDESGPDDVDE